jgi:serine/threonine-protein kinase
LLKLGDRIGKYEVECLIVSGGMGSVYRARDVVLHRPVALKFMRPDMTR